ncbi:MAG: response regulator transcription factor [Butyrivibrio sp.]|jgi:DNA-binding response OmpR family regulator|nr:response regulator transcription factor [Butyrivibrio sp.]
MVNILVVEDDDAVRLLTRAELGQQYHVEEAANGLEALEVLAHKHIDLLIVDIQMPEMNGYELIRTLRENKDMRPMIILTAMNTAAHKKEGFASGVDDYMTKPIDYEELNWRIEALLRRAKISNEQKIVIGGFSMERNSFEAVWDDQRISLPAKEFELLYKLLSYPGEIFTKQQLMDEIWGMDSEAEYDTIKSHISRLRNRFEGCSEFELVAVRGLGYKAVINENGK